MIRLRWDVPGLIDALGGPGCFARECEARGYGAVKPKMVRKWLERRSIPPAGLAVAELVLGSRGERLAKFIDDDDQTMGGMPL